MNPNKKTQFRVDLRMLIGLTCALTAMCVWTFVYSDDPIEQKACMILALISSFLVYAMIITHLMVTRKDY